MNPNRKTELLVGLFLLVGLLMLGGLVLQFGSVRQAFRDTYNLSVAFPNAPGNNAGSPVDLGGSRIGKVKGKPLLKEDSSGVIIEIEGNEPSVTRPVGSRTSPRTSICSCSASRSSALTCGNSR